VQAYPKIMSDFFDSFEADVCQEFKLYPESQKAQVEEVLRKETE